MNKLTTQLWKKRTFLGVFFALLAIMFFSRPRPAFASQGTTAVTVMRLENIVKVLPQTGDDKSVLFLLMFGLISIGLALIGLAHSKRRML